MSQSESHQVAHCIHVEIELKKKEKKRKFDFESLVLRKFRKITAISHPWDSYCWCFPGSRCAVTAFCFCLPQQPRHGVTQTKHRQCHPGIPLCFPFVPFRHKTKETTNQHSNDTNAGLFPLQNLESGARSAGAEARSVQFPVHSVRQRELDLAVLEPTAHYLAHRVKIHSAHCTFSTQSENTLSTLHI